MSIKMSNPSFFEKHFSTVKVPKTASYGENVDDLPDAELIRVVDKLRESNKRMELENEVMQNYLMKMDAKSIQGMEKLLHYANMLSQTNTPQIQSDITMLPTTRAESSSSFNSQISNLSMMRSSLMGSWMSGNVSGHRVNLTMRIDLVKRERENVEETLESFRKKSRFKRNSLKAQLEEIMLQISETNEAREIFEQSIVKEGVDPLTSRIPAEKFVRYMEEWLKSADSIIEKLRLRTSTLNYRHVSLQHQLTQKEELGETLHPVDFDQMKIENQQLIAKIEQKNVHLLDLKKSTGESNLVLSRHKRYLQEQLKNKEDIKEAIKENDQKIIAINNESSSVEMEVDNSQEKLIHIKKLIDNFTVPDLIDYVRVKHDLHDLKRNVKIWSRRNHLQKIALDSCIKTMKRLTGKSKETDDWFQLKAKSNDSNLDMIK